MENTVQTNPHTALIAGLRELADWFEQHPELPEWRFPSPSLSYQPIGTSDEDGIAAVEAFAAALGTDVNRSYHIKTKRRFGGVEFSAVKVLASSSTEHAARQKVYDAARWVYTCDGQAFPSPGHETEQAAQQQLDAHRKGCRSRHSVKLVSGEAVLSGGAR